MNLLKLSVFSVLILSSSLYAKDSAHIVTGSSQSSSNVSKNTTYDDGYDVDFSLSVGYDYAFTGGLQLGGTFGSSVYSGGSSWLISAGPGYNFSSDIENSFFAALKFGVVTYHIDSSMSDTTTYVSAEIAKRFKLMENVSYVPGIVVSKELGSNSNDPVFSIEYFRLSLVF